MNRDWVDLLRAEKVAYRSGGRQILAPVSFRVAPGQVVAIIGPSGSGKSSLLRLLNRLDEPTQGTVYLRERDYREISPPELRKQVGLVMQAAFLFPGTVADNLRYALTLRGEVVAHAEIERVLGRVGLEDFDNRDVSRLSGGEAQRVSLARTLLNEPSVLLLDEPTAALDADAQAGVEDLLREIIAERGLTCLLVTHDPRQARRLASHGLLLKAGYMTCFGEIDEVLNADRVV